MYPKRGVVGYGRIYSGSAQAGPDLQVSSLKQYVMFIIMCTRSAWHCTAKAAVSFHASTTITSMFSAGICGCQCQSKIAAESNPHPHLCAQNPNAHSKMCISVRRTGIHSWVGASLNFVGNFCCRFLHWTTFSFWMDLLYSSICQQRSQMCYYIVNIAFIVLKLFLVPRNMKYRWRFVN